MGTGKITSLQSRMRDLRKKRSWENWKIVDWNLIMRYRTKFIILSEHERELLKYRNVHTVPMKFFAYFLIIFSLCFLLTTNKEWLAYLQ